PNTNDYEDCWNYLHGRWRTFHRQLCAHWSSWVRCQMVCRRCRLLGRTSARLVRLQNVAFPAPETMSGRIILLTGANGGLGQAIARSFLQWSSDDFVWLGVHKATEQASLIAKEFSGRCDLLPLDVTRVDSWEDAVKSILQQQQRIDVLVNNAGRHQDG